MKSFSGSVEKYRPDIDGLRAIAIASVVGFHAFPNFFKGGFVGVDIFFVISGYLITGIIADARAESRFSYIDFYIRRIRRIFPALIVVVAATIIVGWYVMLPDEFRRFGKHLAAGAGFGTNFVLWGESGYFDVSSDTKPLLHLWSLAIEEQFYILWPLLLGLVGKDRRGQLFAILSIAGISFAYGVFIVGRDPVAAFYSPLSRFWELMVGGILAYSARQKSFQLPGFQAPRAALGLLLIGGSVFLLNREFTFPGYWALLPTMGAFLIISADSSGWLSKNLLGNRVLVGLGLISYPLYLWHWPILVFAKLVKGSLLAPSERMAAIAAALALAFLTYRYVERPLRRSFNVRVPKLLAAAMACAGAIGLAIFSGGFDSRLRNEHLTPILAAKLDWEYPPVAAENHSLGAIRYFVEDGKLNSYTVFVGDSNMEQYAPRIDWAIRNTPGELNGAILVGNQTSCDLLHEIIVGEDRCPQAIAQLKSLIARSSTRAFVIAMSWIKYSKALTEAANQRRLSTFLRAIVATKPAYLILNIPSGEELAPQNMFTGSRLGEIDAKPVANISFNFVGFRDTYSEINAILSTIAHHSGAQIIDPIPYLCPDDRCPVFDENGTPLYLDATHLTRRYAMKAATFIDRTLVPSK